MIEKLNKDALETTKRLLLKAHEASVFAKAISGIPSGPTSTIYAAQFAALEAAGHNTAAALLASGNWTQTGDASRSKLVKKTYARPHHERRGRKIVKSAAREAGCLQPVAVISNINGSSENSTSAAPAKRVVDSNPSLTTPAVKK